MFKKIVWITLGVLLIGTIVFIFSFDRKLDEMTIDTDKAIVKTPPSQESSVDPSSTAEEDPEDFYVLMIGLDQRGNDLMLNTDS